jgi:capsular exopolysaccharide synthesis family protein
MSKIFDALNKNPGQLPDLGIWALSEEFKEKMAAVDSAAEIPANLLDPEPLPGPESLPEPMAVPAPAPSESVSAVGIRTMPVQITKESPLFPYDGDHWHAAEQYRVARTKIVQHPRQPRMLVVSSATPADGKTLTAINLAAALAMKGEGNVLLADADFRLSAVHDRLGFPSAPGLADVLAGSASLEQSLIRTEQFPSLYVLPAGARPRNPTEILASSRWRALCELFASSFKYVILDSPPIGAVADYELIQAACDGVLLVVRPDHTARTPCFQAIKAVPKEKFIGVILNCVPEWFLSRQYRYSEYGYDAYQTNAK